MHAVGTLLSNASGSIGEPITVGETRRRLDRWGTLGHELADILATRNGFYAYGGALLFRPMSHEARPLGLIQWNQAALWRDDYAPEFGLGDSLFFAEDLFGEQFCLVNSRLCLFHPETGAFQDIGDSLSQFLRLLLADPNIVTGYPLLRDWEHAHDRLAPGMRLLPNRPFVAGGEYAVANLGSSDEVAAMKSRAVLANKIRSTPEAAEILSDAKPTRPPN